MMQCEKVQKRLSAYLDDELDPWLRRTVADHLNQCAECREGLTDFQNLDTRVGGLGRLDIPPGFAENLVAKICKESVAANRRYLEGRVSNPLLRLLENFFELLEPARSRRTRSLEEFADFPPLSMGYLYCKILDQC